MRLGRTKSLEILTSASEAPALRRHYLWFSLIHLTIPFSSSHCFSRNLSSSSLFPDLLAASHASTNCLAVEVVMSGCLTREYQLT